MTVAPLDLPELFHLGWVVRDCAAAAAGLAERLGADPFHHAADASRFEHALVHGEATPPLELLVDGTGPGNPVRWAYLEGGAAHGAVIELLERSPLAEERFHDVLALVGR